MVFKQGIVKEEKIKFLVQIISVLIPWIAIVIVALIRRDDIEILLLLSCGFFLPMTVISILVALKNLESFHIYEDGIVVTNVYGIKNAVCFDKVLFVEELTIRLYRTGMEKPFYVFNDGRKNNNSFLDLNSCYNKKKFNLRIHKTPELENYVTNILKFEIVK